MKTQLQDYYICAEDLNLSHACFLVDSSVSMCPDGPRLVDFVCSLLVFLTPKLLQSFLPLFTQPYQIIKKSSIRLLHSTALLIFFLETLENSHTLKK